LRNKETISDNDLFKEFVDSGKANHLFNEIINRFKFKIYQQARRIVFIHQDADEVCQLVFIKLWKHADSFKFQSQLSSFIYRITYNESISLLKRNHKNYNIDDYLDKDGHYHSMVTKGDTISADEIFKNLISATLTLPEKQRLVFNYRYFDELSYKEISDITGTSESALKASYHFAVEKIKKIINPD
jgi:RNA polymerase sigma-70 factor (ECF subfamily)